MKILIHQIEVTFRYEYIAKLEGNLEKQIFNVDQELLIGGVSW